MKILLASFVLLLPHITQAQIKLRPQIKKTIAKSAKAVPIRYNKPVEQLSVGDTCYVTISSLAMHGRPEVTSPAAYHLQLNAKVIVREVLNEQWVLVDYYNLDVGLDGYVSRQYLLRKKTD